MGPIKLKPSSKTKLDSLKESDNASKNRIEVDFKTKQPISGSNDTRNVEEDIKTARINNYKNNTTNVWFRKIEIDSLSDIEKEEREQIHNQNRCNTIQEFGDKGSKVLVLHLDSCSSSDCLCEKGRHSDGDDDDDDNCNAVMVSEKIAAEDLDSDVGSISHKFTGLALALLSCLAYSLSSLIVKYMKDYHPFSKSVWRFQGLVVPAIPMMLYSYRVKKEPVFETVWPACGNGNGKNIWFLTLRAITGFATIIPQFYSLQYITLADHMVLGSCQPVFVSIAAYFTLGEQCGIVPFAICCLTILGVCVVAKPPILTGAEAFDENVLIGSGLAIFSMAMSVVSIVLMRRMKHVHFTLITFAFGAYSTIFSIICALIFDVFQWPQGRDHIIIAIALASLVFVSQTCTTIALKYEQAGPVSLVRTSNIIFGFVWQFVFLGVLPDHLSVIGASIITIGLLLTGLRKWISTLPEIHWAREKFRWMLK